MQLPDGWIEWAGGPCPVLETSRPAVMFRDGETTAIGEFTAGPWYWGRARRERQGPNPRDIIAYKPEHPRHD